MIITLLEAKIAEVTLKIESLKSKSLYGLVAENQLILNYLNKELGRVITSGR